MANVFDVAAYVLKSRGAMTTMKLQKLVYYCQAWSLVWDERPLFDEPVEAWANGPVVRRLYDFHKGWFDIGPESLARVGDPGVLNEAQRATIDSVLNYYADKPTQWLIDLTHMEDPWKDARQGIPETARSNAEISPASMAEYYSSLQSQSDGQA